MKTMLNDLTFIALVAALAWLSVQLVSHLTHDERAIRILDSAILIAALLALGLRFLA